MTNYKVVVGEIYIRDGHTGRMLSDEAYPLSIANVIVDSVEVANHLVEILGPKKFKLVVETSTPEFFDYQLN